MKTLLISIVTILTFVGLFAGMYSVNEHSEVDVVAAAAPGMEYNTADLPLSENSVYQLPGEWTSADLEKISLKEFRGKIQIVSMIYTSCGFACPRIVENMRDIKDQLPDNIKNNVGFLLTSFDTERDTPEKLAEYAAQRDLEEDWHLLHGNEMQVRTLSMLLDTQYDELGGGFFNHSNVITILDEGGVIIAQFKGLTPDINEIVKTIKVASAS